MQNPHHDVLCDPRKPSHASPLPFSSPPCLLPALSFRISPSFLTYLPPLPSYSMCGNFCLLTTKYLFQTKTIFHSSKIN